MAYGLKVRGMKSSDIHDVLSLGQSTPELLDGPEAIYLGRDILEAYIASEHDILLSLVDGKKLAGFLICNYHPIARNAYLQDMVVAKQYRNEGHGKQLYNAMIDNLKERGFRSIWALVKPENKTMLKFLEKQGYTRGDPFLLFSKED